MRIGERAEGRGEIGIVFLELRIADLARELLEVFGIGSVFVSCTQNSARASVTPARGVGTAIDDAAEIRTATYSVTVRKLSATWINPACDR